MSITATATTTIIITIIMIFMIMIIIINTVLRQQDIIIFLSISIGHPLSSWTIEISYAADRTCFSEQA